MPSRDEIIEILKTVVDPEIHLDIWFLGLIYNLDISQTKLAVEMTFTSPMCPYGPVMVEEIETKLKALPGVEAVEVNVVFEPTWEPSDEVKSVLGIL